MSELVGLCVYCEKPASNTCMLCGAIVCSEHFIKEKGICTSCALGRRVSGPKVEVK